MTVPRSPAPAHVEFRPSATHSVGIEWELALVDAGTGDLVQAADEVLEAVRPDGQDAHPRIHPELLLNTVELVTGICATVPEAVADLQRSLEEVRAVTDPRGIEVLSAGTHPFASWRQQQVTPGERYATLIDRTQWWGRQMLVYGVHVHVGMPDPTRVLPVLNALLRYLPHLQALSASSPFWGGQDTGYASNRALMFQQLPTAGLPFQFDTWPAFEAYLRDMFTTGVIEQHKDIRWDVRPSPALGTLEVRVCDGMPTLAEVAATSALTHCLVVDLDERLASGEALPRLPQWHVQENKWRSARYGLDAIVITDDTSSERLVTDDLTDLLDRITPVAERLGCAAELAFVADIIARGASYRRQRRAAASAGGDLASVARSLVAEMRAGHPLP
jgi:glutamate---cysteine ligase / carboxylate-amine ligase